MDELRTVVPCMGECGAWLPIEQETVAIKVGANQWAHVRLCEMCLARMHDFRRKVVKKRQKQPA